MPRITLKPKVIVPNVEKGMEISKEINRLHKHRKEDIVPAFKNLSRVDSYGSGKGISKTDMISELLENKFGSGYYVHVEAYKKQIKEDAKKVKKMLAMLKKEKK